MDWPTGLFKWSSYDRRKAEAIASHGGNGTAPPAEPAADAERALAIATEPIVGQRPSDNGHRTADSDHRASDSGHRAAELVTETSATSTGHVVHDLLKGLEVSFGVEASQLERESLETARSWAEKGLPRHDIAANGRLEVEGMLAHRASHVFSDWARRVRDRVEDAIQSDSEQVGARLVTLEQRVQRYRYQLDELRASRAAVVQAQAQDEQRAAEAARAPRRRVAYAARLGSIPFWFFCAILVLADFVANVPVFNELLPSSPVATQALQNIETNAAANPETYGWKTFWARLTMHLDASILAFSVVLFLVVLGHFFGGALRTIVALHRARPLVDDELLHKHRHQPTVVAWLSLTGILTIVTVLFLARAGIESASSERLDTRGGRRRREAAAGCRGAAEKRSRPRAAVGRRASDARGAGAGAQRAARVRGLDRVDQLADRGAQSRARALRRVARVSTPVGEPGAGPRTFGAGARSAGTLPRSQDGGRGGARVRLRADVRDRYAAQTHHASR